MESFFLQLIRCLPFIRSQAYSPIKTSLAIFSVENIPNYVPNTVFIDGLSVIIGLA